MRKISRFIIPRIYKKNDCWIIQWVGNDYCIKQNIIKEKMSDYFTKYFLIEFLLLILIWSVTDLCPPKNTEEIFKMLILSVLSGMLSGVAVVEDRENRDK